MSISHPRYNPRSNMYVHCHSMPTSSRTTLFVWDGGKLALPCLEHRQQELQRAIISGLLGLLISAAEDLEELNIDLQCHEVSSLQVEDSDLASLTGGHIRHSNERGLVRLFLEKQQGAHYAIHSSTADLDPGTFNHARSRLYLAGKRRWFCTSDDKKKHISGHPQISSSPSYERWWNILPSCYPPALAD